MSSTFSHVTVVPAFTVSLSGPKVKLSILTITSAACAAPGSIRPPAIKASVKSRARARTRAMHIFVFVRSAQGFVDDRKPLLAALEGDVAGAKHGAQLVVSDFHRARRGRGARRRLREGSRARGVERHVALDLLHDLVDVAVEHGHRAEAFQVTERLGAVLGAPAPVLEDGPERNVGEHHDRRF